MHRHVLVWIVIFTSFALDAARAERVQQPETLAREYVEAWNSRDVEEITLFFAPGGVYVDVTSVNNGWATPWEGHEEIRRAVADLYAAIPDFAFEVRSVHSGENFAIIEWTMRGTHSADWKTLPATGRTLSVPGVSVIEFADEMIRRQRDYWDGYLFMSQLGALPGSGGD